jgi:hypothetical protein
MPSANPYAPVFEIGGTGEATAGPAQGIAGGKLSLGTLAAPEDHHIAAALVLAAVLTLVLLWRGKFRFSMTTGVGGR